MRTPFLLLFFGSILTLGLNAQEHLEERLSKLENMVQSLQKELNTRNQKIDVLEKEINRLQTGGRAAQGEAGVSEDALLDQLISGEKKQEEPGQLKNLSLGPLKLIDISAIVDVAAGTSSERDPVIEQLQGGGHDPRNRGFSLQQLELSLSGAVDPYFDLEAHIVFSEGAVELEEAFGTSTALPAGLELKVGYFLTEFGRVNGQHPHSWSWMDQPIIATRLLGGEGMRGPGARLGWLTPLPWYSQVMVGMQQSTGEFMGSFRGGELAHSHDEDHGHEEEEEHEHDISRDEDEDHDEEHEDDAVTIGGRPIVEYETSNMDDFVYLVRWINGFTLTDEVSAEWGLSGLYGSNASGPDGETFMYGTDLTLKWERANRNLGRPLLEWQTEFMQRKFDADAYIGEEFELPSDTLTDWGLYTQLVYALNRDWSIGLRYEYATGSGDNYEHDEIADRSEDALRADRTRLSPLVIYHPTEFTRLRLQVNYDEADHLESGDAVSVWLGFEWLIGSHPTHKY